MDQLKQNNILFSALCFQETWFSDSMDQIENYICISRGKLCSEHGGLAVYLHQNYNFENLDLFINSEIWEAQFINLNNRNGKTIVLGNVYRPPKCTTDEMLRHFINDEMLRHFINEIDRVLVEINKTKSVVMLAGDFNINLLKIYERPIFIEYFETLYSNNLVPTLTLPTRITDISATLIDNIFINVNRKLCASGIIITDISDNFPSFCRINIKNEYVKPPKYMFFRRYTAANINNLYHD